MELSDRVRELEQHLSALVEAKVRVCPPNAFARSARASLARRRCACGALWFQSHAENLSLWSLLFRLEWPTVKAKRFYHLLYPAEDGLLLRKLGAPLQRRPLSWHPRQAGHGGGPDMNQWMTGASCRAGPAVAGVRHPPRWSRMPRACPRAATFRAPTRSRLWLQHRNRDGRPAPPPAGSAQHGKPAARDRQFVQ